MTRHQVYALVFALLVTQPAAAESSATELLDAAIEQFSSGEFSTAGKLLEKAKSQTRQPKLLGQIHLYLGVNFEAMKQVVAAKSAFRAALRYDATLSLDPGRFKTAVVDMFRRIQKRTIGLLVISGRAGATVLIDGQPRGTSPLSVRLPKGSHELVAQDTSGATMYSEQVIVSAGEKAEVVLPAPVRRIDERADPVRKKKARKIRHRRRDVDDSWFDWSIWMGIGGVVAIAGVGIGFGVSSKLHEDQAFDLDVPHDEAKRHHDSATSQATAANIFLVTSGVVAVVVSIWAYVKHRRHKRKQARSALSVSPTGVALRW